MTCKNFEVFNLMKNNSMQHTEKIIPEAIARQLMWEFYRINKKKISTDAHNFRELIVSELMMGKDAKEVFGKFINGSASTNTGLTKKTKLTELDEFKQSKPPWPFN